MPPSGHSDSPPSFEDLLRRARQSEAAAMDGLLVGHYRYLLDLANELQYDNLQAKAGASDFVQDALLIIRSKLSQFDGTTQPEFMAWIRQILVNQVQQFRRRYEFTAKRRVGLESPIETGDSSLDQRHVPAADTVSPATHAADNERFGMLQQALLQLPEDYQQVIRLRYWEQLTFDEIGSRIDRSGEAVRKLWMRAVVRLEAVLSEMGVKPSALDLPKGK